MRKLYLLFSLLILTAAPSRAQDFPRVEIFGGYSYTNNEVILQNERTDLHGFNINAAYNFNRYFGVVFDVAGHFGDEDVVVTDPLGTSRLLNIGIDNYTYMGGPRYTYRGFERFTPFAHALFGVQNTRWVGASEVNFAYAVGGGFDVNINDHFAIRPVQAEFLGVNFDDSVDFGNTTNFRVSTGIVFKF